MADRTFLTWSFFEARQRAFADRLDAWVAAEIAPLEAGADHHTDEGLDDACAEILQALGKGGWLRNAVPVDGPLDVRTLCLTRETLARTSGLADFVFAIQGLGSGPLSLFATDGQKAACRPAVAGGSKRAGLSLG